MKYLFYFLDEICRDYYSFCFRGWAMAGLMFVVFVFDGMFNGVIMGIIDNIMSASQFKP